MREKTIRLLKKKKKTEKRRKEKNNALTDTIYTAAKRNI